MIFCKTLNKDFDSKKAMFKALKANKELILSEKKNKVLKSIDKGVSIKFKPLDGSKISGANKEMFSDSKYFYIVMNTTGVLDSHMDLHDKGIWNKTAKERNRKNYIVDTHKMSIDTTIARKEDVEIFVAEIPFSLINNKYGGNTEALIYKVAKDKVIHQKALDWLESGASIEGSVSMQYVKIELAMNSRDPEDEEEYKNYLLNVDKIANKDNFEEIDYFFIIKEAKNTPESSLVLQGSNSVTGVIEDNTEAVKHTSESEPLKDTQKEVIDFIKGKVFIK